MRKKHSPDYLLLGIIIILLICGILILASASVSWAQKRVGNPIYFLVHQIGFGLLPGIILGYLIFKLPITSLQKWAMPLLFFNLFLLLLVFFPGIGLSLGGAHRWINFGFFSLQPSEFLKVTFILYLSAWISNRTRKKDGKVKGEFFSFILILLVVSGFLILQPDVSTLVTIVATALLLYFAVGTPISHTLLMLLMGIGFLFFLIKTSTYRFHRFITFLHPEIDPMGIGYQIKQSLIAVGSGGIWGQGLGANLQKIVLLPHPMSDSIFAIWAEEVGFLGSFILVLLFLLFAWRGFWIAKKSEDKFSQLSALGITFWIVFQAFVNIGAMLGILPLTGIPLPFFSYGGSALIAELLGISILLNISQYSRTSLT